MQCREKKKYLKIVSGVEALCCCINKAFFIPSKVTQGLHWPGLTLPRAGLGLSQLLPWAHIPVACCAWARSVPVSVRRIWQTQGVSAQQTRASGSWAWAGCRAMLTLTWCSQKAAAWGKETYDNTHKQVLELKRKTPPPLMPLLS